MTTDEHILMLTLFFKQKVAIRILLNMLKSRDLLTDDDERAFASAQVQDVGLTAALHHEARREYLALAHSAGIQTGLEQLPEPPIDWFRPPNL